MKKCLFILLFACSAMFVSAADKAVGRYSVSAKGRQVEFMNSNVKFTPSLFLWEQHTAARDTLSNRNILHSATTNSIDLFAWSASTYSNWGISALSEDLLFGGEFVDWGLNFPMNKGDLEHWSTLSADEWDYLLNGRYHAAELRAYSHLGAMSGWIILADSSTQSIQSSYTLTEWETLAQTGAIFLPMSGKRMGGQSVDSSVGIYWTNTPVDAKNAKAVCFTSSDAIAIVSVPRSAGGAVRLAHRLSLTLTATPPPCQVFDKWSDGNTDNPRVLGPNDDTDVTPLFKEKIYTIQASVNSSIAGSVRVAINQDE